MNYFAVERGGDYWDHIIIRDKDNNAVFENYLDMTYDEMKSQGDLEDFVVAIMEATNAEVDGSDAETVLTLVGKDDVFIWGIIMDASEDDMINYVLVDWKKDGKSYRYAPS